MRPALPAAVLVALSPAFAAAQPERYELGKRLQRFEQAWEAQPDPAVRKTALALVEKVTPQFFAFKLGEAGRTLDAARYALTAEPSAAAKWLESLHAVPEKRLVDAKTKTLAVAVKAFYPHAGDVPKGAAARVWIGPGPKVEVPLGKLPAKLAVPFPDGGWEGDWFLKLELTLDGKPVREDAVRVTTLHDLDRVLAEFRDARRGRKELAPGGPRTLELATIEDRHDLLQEFADGLSPETDFPLAALTREAERMALLGVFGGRYFAADRPGDFRLSVPVGKKSVPVRVFVPKGLAKEKPVPVVFALHGAGGSENLFFDAYGAGHVVKECEKRGWLLVAPRSGLSFGGGPPVPAVVEKLAERYPIDAKRVFLVGHSMGAAQTVALCQAHPGAFAAAAALGGGGRVTDAKAFGKLPVFVGVGAKDFALAMSRGLAKALGGAGAAVTAKEYPDVEHLVIVREALPDVFKVFDSAK